MLRNRIYYQIKPLLPARLRYAVRGWLARRKRPAVGGTWPIAPGSERPPEGWSGWPDGKEFALVLTHDVEGQAGLDKCLELMELERGLGFRSAFNLIPESNYLVSSKLREQLRQNDFEVGVHDLHHDGKLYHSHSEFLQKAVRINQYLRDWGAVGFRSGFMLHNLDWIHELNIQYDGSTFDTDPFEPQPHGQNTIFPFWVPRQATGGQPPAVRPARETYSPATGYVELPYTLPQDSTLFLLLRERNPGLWLGKLDWIAQHGGMALVNVHPDYVAFDGTTNDPCQYPAKFYRRLLEYTRTKYAGRYWHALPHEVAAYFRKTLLDRNSAMPQVMNQTSSQESKISL